MDIRETVPGSAKKKRVIKIAAIFTAVMLFLTFFSKTLNNFLLPKVTCETPSGGALIKQVKAEGKVEAKKYDVFYAPEGIEILDVAVKTGDPVSKGQILMKLDVSQFESQLEDEKAKLEQKKLILEGLADKNCMQSYDVAVNDALLDMDNAGKAYESAHASVEDMEELYLAGAETKSEYNDAKAETDKAKLAYEKAKLDYESAKANRLKAIGDNERSVETARYDIMIGERTIDSLEKKVEMGTLTAQSDGVIGELNALEGELTDSSKPLYRIALLSNGFRFVFTTDVKSAENLKPGDTGDILINAAGTEAIQGTVTGVTDNRQSNGEKKDVFMDIPSGGFAEGEKGSVSISKNTDAYELLVPNTAIGQDSGGYFVYVLKYRKGPLGNEYYVRMLKLSVLDNDDGKTAVAGGLTGSDEVVSSSDKQLSEGMQVMPAIEEAEN